MKEPDKIIKVEYGDRTFFALLMFALTIGILIVVYFKVNSDSELIQQQQDLIETKSEQIKEYISQLNEMHLTLSFIGGQMVEQTNVFRHKCFEVAAMLEDHIEKQKQMISEFVLPTEEKNN
jgi:hypothetical protein